VTIGEDPGTRAPGATLEARLAQQSAVAETALAALGDRPIAELTNELVGRVAAVLGVDYAMVLELLPGEGELLLRAGVGWRDGEVGRRTAPAGAGWQARYAPPDQQPRIAPDVRSDASLRELPPLCDHDVACGITALIPGAPGAAVGLGVLGAFAREPRDFTSDEARFVQSMAAVLGSALARRRADDARRHSAESLATTLYSIGDAVIATDEQGRVLRMNPVAERLTGWAEAEAQGRALDEVFEIVSEVTRLPAANPVDRVLREGVIIGLANHTALIARDGTERPIADSGAPIRGENGAVRGAVLVFRDVTEERRAEAALRESETRYRRQGELLSVVLQGAADGITAHDQRGLLYANDAAGRVTGYPSGQALLDAPPGDWASRFEITDESGAPLAVEHFPGRRALAGEDTPPMLMHVREKATGRDWWSLVASKPVLDESGRPIMAVNIFRDVTQQRRREQQARFMAEASTLLASGLDYAATLERIARLAVPHLADWCSVEVLEEGKLVSLAVAHVDPARIELAREIHRKYPPDPNAPSGSPNVVRTGRAEIYPDIPDELLVAATVNEEHLKMSRDLGLKSALCVPLLARGRALGALTLIAAESGRCYGAEDLALAEELGRQAGMAVENSMLYREATQAINLRDDFMSIAGHELKTPLGAALLQVQLLIRMTKERTEPARLEERAEKAVRNLARLNVLINELLDVSRITAGRLKLELEDVDVTALVRDVLNRHSEELVRAECELRFTAGEPIVGRWDRMRLEQVFANLLTNAVKYGKGKPIEVTLGLSNGTARLTVRDHGIGIAPEDQARIFERFERAVSTRQFGGLGLGLWIARQIVEAHKGTIQVDSALGRGSTFQVELPSGSGSSE
jgi:PAS domain S-box-containing protein